MLNKKLFSFVAITSSVLFYSQQNPNLELQIKQYSSKVDSIVHSEKKKMNVELETIDADFKDGKISNDEKMLRKKSIAESFEKTINDKIETEKVVLDDITRESVKNSVYGTNAGQEPNNQLMVGLTGLKMKLNQKDKKTPKDLLKGWDLSISYVGTNLTSKDEPFRFYSRDSDVRRTIYNAASFTLRYENQIGGYRSPLFYHIGLGFRGDTYIPKYGRVFTQENNTLDIKEFTKGNLRRTKLYNSYIFVPVDLRFVLNPKYIDHEGIKYLDNKKPQLSLVAGVYGGVRAGTVINNNYSTSYTKRIVERERVMHGMTDFIFGAKLGVGYGGLNLFVQKDLTPTFNNNANLNKKYALQIGIEIANIKF